MTKQLDKEKLVRDLISSFNNRDELHIAYKKKMKSILKGAVYEFYNFIAESESDRTLREVDQWVDNFVEERFTQSDN